VDGASAQPILEAMSSGDLPNTVSWTSGKPGRYQLLFQVPPDIRVNLQNFTRYVVTQWQGIETAKDESGKPSELLEFRYNCCQSVLPPSRHPDTGAYRWLNSVANTSVALAPTWLCNLLLDFASEEQRHIAETSKRIERVKTQRQERKLTPISSNNGSLSDVLDLSLSRLNPEDVFNWSGHNWRVQGRVIALDITLKAERLSSSIPIHSNGIVLAVMLAVMLPSIVILLVVGTEPQKGQTLLR